MRIIGGAFRGRKLAALGKGDEAAHLRPTSDRVRESLFNVLMARFADRIEGAAVLDLFAGSGALGLEALSRGAASALFVENGRMGLKLLRENIALCGAESVSQVTPKDALKLGQASTAHGLVFVDPPYGKSMGEAALANAIQMGWLSAETLVIWEEGVQIKPPKGLILLDTRLYGETRIHILERG